MQLITATIDIVAVVVVPLSSTAVATTELNCATGQCQMAKSGETGSGPMHWPCSIVNGTSVAVSRGAFITPTCNCDCNWSTAVPFGAPSGDEWEICPRISTHGLIVVAAAAAVAPAPASASAPPSAPAAMAMLCVGQRHRLNRPAPRCTSSGRAKRWAN